MTYPASDADRASKQVPHFCLVLIPYPIRERVYILLKGSHTRVFSKVSGFEQKERQKHNYPLIMTLFNILCALVKFHQKHFNF